MGTIEGPATAEVGPLGADEALSALYAAHWRGLVRLSWLLVRDQQAAEDVVQEAFVATYRRWSALRSPDAALGYLRTATVNGSRSALRKRGVRERYAAAEAARLRLARPAVAPGDDVRPGAATLGVAGPTVASAESAVLDASRRAEVLELLGSLPTRQREVLVLRYYLDLAEADIASSLGISRGAVKSHASRGLAALRVRFAGPDDTDGGAPSGPTAAEGDRP